MRASSEVARSDGLPCELELTASQPDARTGTAENIPPREAIGPWSLYWQKDVAVVMLAVMQGSERQHSLRHCAVQVTWSQLAAAPAQI